MGYSELIKSFAKVRDYMRDFYIFGFKNRNEYDTKSMRSYDNERRRLESWLGEYMSFRQNPAGKTTFISIDSRKIIRNPLYKAFKAKSFTANDIKLNFFLLDMLAMGGSHTVNEITDILDSEYLASFDPTGNEPLTIDESTVRLKLKEYEELGLLVSKKRDKKLYYSLKQETVPLEKWHDALGFYSEEDPLGVVGSYLLDKLHDNPEYFRFKHHYIFHALESEVLYELLLAIDEKHGVKIDTFNPLRGVPATLEVTPLKILISTQGGRRYLLAFSHRARRITTFRLDNIKAVRIDDKVKRHDSFKSQSLKFMENLWGVSAGDDADLDHIEMTVHASQDEAHIPARLEREKRCGRVESLGGNLYRFTADVYDATEMIPWLRTFIGRIVSLECSNKYVCERFSNDLRELNAMYEGGVADVVS
jgi:DNA-binding transcriptional ArsR family regulator